MASRSRPRSSPLPAGYIEDELSGEHARTVPEMARVAPPQRDSAGTLASATAAPSRSSSEVPSERSSRISRLEAELEEARRELHGSAPPGEPAPAPPVEDPSRLVTRRAPPLAGGEDVFARETVRRAIAAPVSSAPRGGADRPSLDGATQVTSFAAPDATIPTAVPFHPDPSRGAPEVVAPEGRRSGATWPPLGEVEPVTAPDGERSSADEVQPGRRIRANTGGGQLGFAVPRERPSFLLPTSGRVDALAGDRRAEVGAPLGDDELRVVRPRIPWLGISLVALALVLVPVALALGGLLGR